MRGACQRIVNNCGGDMNVFVVLRSDIIILVLNINTDLQGKEMFSIFLIMNLLLTNKYNAPIKTMIISIFSK